MPPVLNSLGPITDWLSGILFGPVIQQCDAVNRASSVASSAKVSLPGLSLSVLRAMIGMLSLLQSIVLTLQYDVAADPMALSESS